MSVGLQYLKRIADALKRMTGGVKSTGGKTVISVNASSSSGGGNSSAMKAKALENIIREGLFITVEESGQDVEKSGLAVIAKDLSEL